MHTCTFNEDTPALLTLRNFAITSARAMKLGHRNTGEDHYNASVEVKQQQMINSGHAVRVAVAKN